MVQMYLLSPQFNHHDILPEEHSCEGDNIAPELEVHNIPDQTKSLALICDDPDAPTDEPFVHWVLWTNTIDDDPFIISEDSLEALGIVQGRNSAGSDGYTGPCPPEDHGEHRYFFTVYALNKEIDLPEGATKNDLLEIIDEHTLAEAEIIGLYTRE